MNNTYLQGNLLDECKLSDWSTEFLLKQSTEGRFVHSDELSKFLKSENMRVNNSKENIGYHFESETFLDPLFLDLYFNSYVCNWTDYLTSFEDLNPRLKVWFQGFDRHFRLGD